MKQPTADAVLNKVLHAYECARQKHSPMQSAHEGYAVILEELDEVWDEIKTDRFEAAKAEMLQVAAMAIAFIVET